MTFGDPATNTDTDMFGLTFTHAPTGVTIYFREGNLRVGDGAGITPQADADAAFQALVDSLSDPAVWTILGASKVMTTTSVVTPTEPDPEP